MTIPRRDPPRRGSAQGGVTLVETLLATTILALALLGHAATTLAEHRLSRVEQARSEVLHTARQFVERLRADDDWSGLYDRLQVLQEAAASAAPTEGGEAILFADGRSGHSPAAYYWDFAPPTGIEELGVIVDVPSQGVLGGGLREDTVAPRFGLPADLNGDGVIDAESHDQDYDALPVVLNIRWVPPGEDARELRILSWLRRNQ